MLSQPFSLARNYCPKEEREEDFSDIIVEMMKGKENEIYRF